MTYFNIIRNGDIKTIQTVNDQQFWNDIIQGFKIFGLLDTEVDGVFTILSSILFLGNIQIDT